VVHAYTALFIVKYKVEYSEMDKTQLSPEQQIAWAQGKLVTSVFLRDIAGCHAAWQVLRKFRSFVVHRQPHQEWRNSLKVI
jgi:hypothetical protein